MYGFVLLKYTKCVKNIPIIMLIDLALTIFIFVLYIYIFILYIELLEMFATALHFYQL